jgi:hypothetical protein
MRWKLFAIINSFPRFGKDEPRENVLYPDHEIIASSSTARLSWHYINSRELAAMISDNVDITSADQTISSFVSRWTSFWNMISRLGREEMIEMPPKTKGGAPAAA